MITGYIITALALVFLTGYRVGRECSNDQAYNAGEKDGFLQGVRSERRFQQD